LTVGVAQRATAAETLAGLQVEKAKTEGDRRIVEADLGPVRHLAALLGATDEKVMRWFILVVALLLDPAAVPLLLGGDFTTQAITGRGSRPPAVPSPQTIWPPAAAAVALPAAQ
jgi:hypothetical protein